MSRRSSTVEGRPPADRADSTSREGPAGALARHPEGPGGEARAGADPGDAEAPEAGEGARAAAGRRQAGVRVPQQARSRRTRRRIVDAAMLCFEESGYDETTTAVIAKRAGIAVGTLYGYFENKGDILQEVVDRTLGEVNALVIEQLAPSTWQGRDPREVVRTLIDTLFHIQTIRPGTQRLILERYFKDAGFREVVEARHDRTRAAIVGFLEAIGPDAGLRTVSFDAAAWTIHNAVQWNASQSIMHHADEPEALDAAAREAADMIGRYLFE